MTDEAKVKQQLKKFLTDIGAYWFMPATFGMGRSGVPDIVVCHNGQFIGIECKGTPKNHTTALQRRELAKILDAGGTAIVADVTNLDEVKKVLSEPTTQRDFRRQSDKVD